MPSDPNTLSHVNGEENCVICVEHITGEEKYDCEMLNVSIRESKILYGRVCCDRLSGSFLKVLYLYLW